jgi:hypothetical protein
MGCITVLPGEMKRGVPLASYVVRKMQDYTNRADKSFGRAGFYQELQIREHIEEDLGDEPAPPPKPVWPDAR